MKIVALQPCNECGNQVSTKARSCPNCGAPFSSAEVPTPNNPLQDTSPPLPSASTVDKVIWKGRPAIRSDFSSLFGASFYWLAALLLVVGLQFEPVSSAFLPLEANWEMAYESLFLTLNSENTIPPISLPTFIMLTFILLGFFQLVKTLFWSLKTKYLVTEGIILVTRGVIGRHKDQMLLITIKVLKLHQSIIERLLNIGTIEFISSDPTLSNLKLYGISCPDRTFEKINGAWRSAVRGRGVVRW